jgi:very-short-patch-repair endonuclease
VVTADLLTQIRAAGLPEPVAEFPFHPERKWRWDWCWPDRLLAVEVDGGLWIRGRHSRGKGQEGDMEKRAEGTLLGWKVLVFSTDQVASGYALECIRRALNTD